MSYQALLEDLAAIDASMHKSFAPKKGKKDEADKKIQAASEAESEEEENEEAGNEQEQEEENEEGGEKTVNDKKTIAKSTKKPTEKTVKKEAKAAGGEEENEETPMEKSYILTMDDGTEIELVDKKSMLKAFAPTLNIMKSMVEQINALNKRVEELSGKGSGRKTVITVTEKSGGGMHKSQPTGVTSEEFFSKAFAAQKTGRINGIDISTAEAYLAKGLAIPAQLIQRVMAA